MEAQVGDRLSQGRLQKAECEMACDSEGRNVLSRPERQCRDQYVVRDLEYVRTRPSRHGARNDEERAVSHGGAAQVDG